MMKRYKLILLLLLALLIGVSIGATPVQYYGTVDRIVEDHAVVEVQLRNQLAFEVIPLANFSKPVNEGDRVIVTNK